MIAVHERRVWDRHWRALDEPSSLFGRLASLVRRLVLRPAVAVYAGRHLPARGLHLEAGCGSAEASAGIVPGERRMLGLDLSLAALRRARGRPPHRWLVAADLRSLPLRDDSVAGSWNLGVMEHFPQQEGIAVLRELGRVLAPGGVALLFWPPELGSSRWVLAPLEWLRTRLTGRPFRFFPDEVNRLSSRRQARAVLAAAELEPLAIDLTWRDAFIHLVVVARKPP